MAKDVIIACDFASEEALFNFLDLFKEEKPYLKVGMELFYAAGPQIVKEIKKRGHKIFLDLKLHDIPTTVKKAMSVLSNLDVDMCNLHASGTIPMMEAALEGLTRPDGTRPILLAVTQLTSTSQEVMERDLLITFFNGKYTVDALEIGEEYIFYGDFTRRMTGGEMNSPIVIKTEESGFLPQYPLTEGLSSKMVSAQMKTAIESCGDLIKESLSTEDRKSVV